MKKKNSYMGSEDDSRFSRALHRARHHDQQPTKESPARKPKNSHRPTMFTAPENNTSLAILFSKETKENRPPGLATQAVDKIKKKKNIWKWGPIRSMGSRSSGDRFPCSYSIYLDSINGLPFTMNALCLFVKLHKKNENTTVQTRPCRVLNGAADIDETLQLQSSVRINAKYDCNIWVSICALEMGGVALSTHCINLSRLVPQASSGFHSPKPGKTWATTVKLSGRVKGALLVVTFACQLLGDASSGRLGLSTPGSEFHVLTTSPTMSELNLDDVPSLESLSSEEHSSQQSLAWSDKEGLGNKKSACYDAENNDILPKKQAERPPDGSTSLTYCDASPIPRDRFLHNLESGNDGNAARSDYSSEDDEVEFSVLDQGVEMGSIAFTERSPGQQEDNPSEKMQTGVNYRWQQGGGSSFRDQMQLIEEELARLEACLVVEDSCRESTLVDGGGNAGDGLKEKMPLCEGCHSEGTLTDNPTDECLTAGNITKESLYADGNMNPEDRLIENLPVNEIWTADSSLKGNQPVDVNWKRLDEDDKKVEETFLHEIAGLSQGKQVLIGSSDEDTDSVTGEFLNLLESGQNACSSMSRSESNFPPALLLREFGQGLFSQIAVSPSPNLEEDLGLSLMDAAKLEMQKAEQVIRSKARARILEDAETQALMQEWGLNEKAFKFSPPKTDYLSAHGKLMGNLISSPPLEEGLGSLVKTKDGGYVGSMNPEHFVNSKIGGRLVMHVSKPVVVPTEMGSSAMDLLRKMAAVGIDNLTSQAMMSMPMEDITGKTIKQIALEGSRTLEGSLNEVARPTSSGIGYGSEVLDSHLTLFRSDEIQMTSKVNSDFLKEESGSRRRSVGPRSTKDSLDEYVSMESLAPLAMQKIEALALEGLKIQSTMADEDTLSYVDPLPLVESSYGNTRKGGVGLAVMDEVASTHKLVSTISDENPIQTGGILASAISLEKWMELDMGIANEADQNKKTHTVKAVHQDLHVTNLKNNSKRKQNNSRFSCMNETLTIAMLIQLRDPLRNYESVGVPMIAIIQAERVIKPPRPKLSKQVQMRANAESEEEDAEEQKPVQLQPQFKITEVHVAGLKAPDSEKKKEWFFQKWGSKKQEQSGSRWLIANGMGKKNKPALHKSKASPSQSKTTVVKPGETLWSISSRVHGTGSKWQEIASLNPHIRNPDIIFPNQTIRMK